MKILIFARGIPSVQDPQDGCFEWDQAKALRQKGHEVVIMAVDGRVRNYWRKIGISKIEKDNIIGYKIFFFPTAIIRRLVSYKMGYSIESKLAQVLYRYIVKKHGNFDILHAHYLIPIFYASCIKKKFNKILIGTEHWSEMKRRVLSKELKYIGDKTYKSVDELIAVSEDLGASIKNHFNKNYHVIHNLIDTVNLEDALPKTNNSSFTIVAVGSLYKIKGFDLLIQSFNESFLKNENVILKIIGEGSERPFLETIIKSNSLDNKVFLCGQKSKKDVFAELHKADLFVLSSRSENFSVALIEATGNGVPAIATLCGGVKEYPIKGVIKIPVENKDEMRKALEQQYLLRDQLDRLGIQKETLEFFSPERIASQIEEIYQEAIIINK